MLKLSTSMQPPTVARAIELLNYHKGKFGGIPLDYDRLCEYYGYYTYWEEYYRKLVCKAIGRNPKDKFTDSIFLSALQAGGVSFEMFGKTKTGGISLSQPSIDAVLETKTLSKDWSEIIELYGKRNSHATIANSMRKLIYNYPIANVQTYDRHRMIFVDPIWVGQTTGRFGMTEPALMNFARIVQDFYTVPGGWLLRKVDSGQIDPRIIQSRYLKDSQLKRCTMLYDDAYYGYLHYCTNLTREEIMSNTLNFDALEVTDTMKEQRQAVKTIGNGVAYGKTSNRDNDPFLAKMIERVGNHPNRIKWQREIENNIERRNFIVHTAFGTPIDITSGPSDANYPDKNSDAYIRHLVSTAFADTVQGTAADLHRFAIEGAHNVLSKEAPNSVLLLSIHDALMYAIHEDEAHRVDDYVKESVSYQVDDWIPINSDLTSGFKQAGNLPRLIA